MREIIVIAALILAAVGLIIGVCVYRKHSKIVQKNSSRLRELQALNQRTMFYGGEVKTYEFQLECASKRQFDNLQFEEFLLSVLEENRENVMEKLQQIDCNRKNYAAYLRESGLIVTLATEEKCVQWQIPLKTFLKHEKRLFKKQLLKKPLWEIAVRLHISYVSPQGKNTYEREEDYAFEQLKYYSERLSELLQNRKTRQYQIRVERAKMTDSLRYDIMKRDNFRCQLCGSTAADGVKLHVDHIQPVAKGGKTTPGNLRTLCDRCNMGKSDKM